MVTGSPIRSGGRPLTAAEWTALSRGLADALRSTGASPRIVARAHPLAVIAVLWRGRVPILTRGAEIWWPGAPDDLSGAGGQMAVLQHELQHVLDYAAGCLTGARYVLHPRHWRYGYRLGTCARWERLGAEQRASMAEHIWLMEHGLMDATDLWRLRDLAPWARPVESVRKV